MTRSLDNETWEANLCINKHRCRSTSRVLTESQKVDVLDILKVSPWQELSL